MEKAIQVVGRSQGHRSLYERAEDILDVVTQVLSRDIRSVRQRQQPHGQRRDRFRGCSALQIARVGEESFEGGDVIADFGRKGEDVLSGIDYREDVACIEVSDKGVKEANDGSLARVGNGNEMNDSDLVEYHLVVEGIDFKYTMNSETRQVIVFGADLAMSKESVGVQDMTHET